MIQEIKGGEDMAGGVGGMVLEVRVMEGRR